MKIPPFKVKKNKVQIALYLIFNFYFPANKTTTKEINGSKIVPATINATTTFPHKVLLGEPCTIYSTLLLALVRFSINFLVSFLAIINSFF